MREFKFRCFIKWANVMLNVAIIDNMRSEIHCFNESGKKNPCDRYSLAEVTLLQYTGLKDKKGVEIYEGDILKVASNGYSNYVSFNGKNCKVEYDEDRCGFIATTGNGYDTRNCFELNCDAEIEVIGNIYENKELLI